MTNDFFPFIGSTFYIYRSILIVDIKHPHLHIAHPNILPSQHPTSNHPPIHSFSHEKSAGCKQCNLIVLLLQRKFCMRMH